MTGQGRAEGGVAIERQGHLDTRHALHLHVHGPTEMQ